jgi:signal transduction histidine kinase
MDVEALRPLDLFDGLTDDQLQELVSGGEDVAITPGTDLFVEGRPADSWWVLVDGALDLLRRVGHEEMVVARMDVPGRWAGGFRAWDGEGVYLATGRGVVPGRVLRVPANLLRELTARWFPFGGHLIDGVFHTARSIEATARQRGSLLTLGTLAAGLAHELNNPAAAATRSVEGLDATLESVLSALSSLAQQDISADQFLALDRLRAELDPSATVLDPLELSDREEALSTWLGRHGVDRDWLIAPPLASAGADVEWCERAAAALGDSVGDGLAWVAGTLTLETLLSEVRESTRRISELVAAVKSYSQVDRAATQEVDVTEGIDSTLVVLGHKIADGVKVVKEYAPDVPRIHAYPGELNQVWTNLIDNALDSMGDTGTLRLVTRLDHNQVVVEVADTGEGMPPEVSARAFDAFFTTKDVGRGTGLGLDIARRIVVDRHGGTIEIESQPGSTVLRVGLPSGDG